MGTPAWLRGLGKTISQVASVFVPQLGAILAPPLPPTKMPSTAATAGPAAAPAAGMPKWVIPVGAGVVGLIVVLLVMKK